MPPAAAESTATASPFAAIFKAYDVRGIVPDQLTVPMAVAIGAGFARFARAAEGASSIAVARDMRASGVELSRALAAGVISEGFTVIDIGLASTDLLYFASGSLDMPGAMLTASHNPAAYNGIKFCLAGAKPVGQDTGLAEIRTGAEEVFVDRDVSQVADVSGHPGYSVTDLLDEFAEHVR